MSPLTHVLLVVAAVGFAQALKPCCVSKIFFGLLKVDKAELKMGSTHSVVSENRLEFEYDADLQMERAAGSIYSSETGASTDYMVISDFKHGHRYSMAQGDASCHMEQISPDDLTPHCVPPTLMWGGEFMVGSGMDNMMVNSWNGAYNNFTYSMQTTVNDCTPVALTRFGIDMDGTRIMENILYVNVTQYHHSRPSVFDLPIQCKDMMPGPIGK